MTIAQQAYNRFKAQLHPDGTNRTVSLILICNWLDGQRSDYRLGGRKIIKYVFADESGLNIRGVGIHHKVEIF